MIPIKFLIIFRELSITQCLRSHTHTQAAASVAHPDATSLRSNSICRATALGHFQEGNQVQGGKWREEEL